MDPGIKKQEGYQNVPMDHRDHFCILPVENAGNCKKMAGNRKNIGFTENDRNRLSGDRSNPGPVLLISGKEENDT